MICTNQISQIADSILKEAVSPPGWAGTVEKMKKNPDITNPFALAWDMYNKGYEPHYPPSKKKKKKK